MLFSSGIDGGLWVYGGTAREPQRCAESDPDPPRPWRRATAGLALRRQLGLLRDGGRVIALNPEIAEGALQFRVAGQQLDGCM